MDIRKIKIKLKNSRAFGPLYMRLKLTRDELRRKSRLRGRYIFENRSKGCDMLCMVLAGYKEYLYPATLGRLEKYAPVNMDICILTSGIYSSEMSKFCEDKGWSYLSTKKNNVSLIQNITIHLFPKAEFIFKLDEDIFITEGYFDNMLRAYHHAEEGNYNPGVIAPLIPLNPYGNMRLLEKLGLVETYTRLFDKPKYSCDLSKEFYKNPTAAKFFWGEDGYIPSIDKMNKQFASEPLEERPCAVRFSIGAIMFRREFWESMDYYPVSHGINMAGDEIALCSFCCLSSLPLMVTENVLVGHLSFLSQNATMKDYFLRHQEIFFPPSKII